MTQATGFLADLEAEDEAESVNGFDSSPDSFMEDDEPAEPVVDPSFMEPPKRSRKAEAYEKKVSAPLRTAITLTASNPATVADSAALYVLGPSIALSLGDLAAVDARVAKAIDWFEGGTESPYLAVAASVAPLLVQLVRNHAPELEPIVEIPIGRKRRMKLKWKIRLDRLESMTSDPESLVNAVYTEEVRESMRRSKISVARFSPRRRHREQQSSD